VKNKKIIMGLAVVLAVIIAIFAVVIITNGPDTNDGEKDVTVTVVYADKT